MIEQLYILPILLFSVVIHEVAHGWMALRLGDTTARDLGRLTLNPIPHIDPIGSVLVPLFSLVAAGRVFIAWAKPVPINPANFSNFRRDDILVSVVGPFSNMCLALCCTLLYILVYKISAVIDHGNPVIDQSSAFFLKMFYGGIFLNIVLAVFNLIPVPPLDGSHVVASLLPAAASMKYRRLGFFGIFIVLILVRWQPFAEVFSGVIRALFVPFDMIIRYCT